MAKEYLAQLDSAAANFATQYNEAVTELHQLTHADVSQLEAEATLARLTEVAERAAALGAPEELMSAAQVRANALHASHVELLHARSRAEAALLDAARVTHTIGYAGVEPLRAALAHATSLRLEGEVVAQTQATLDALVQAEHERVAEHAAATAAIEEATAAAKRDLAQAVEAGATLREFGSCDALREAIKRALAASVEQQLIYEAQHQLVPLEAAERSHHNEVRLPSLAAC